MTNHDLKLADDRPITKQKADLLDRARFAGRLASAISSWKNQESLVIGLTGNWGSGKSSIKNMTLEHLNDNCQVIEFNPWQWADQEKLSSAFFEEVSRIVHRKDASKADKKLAKLLRKYGRHLHTGSGMLSATAKWGPIFLGSALVTTAMGSLAVGTVGQITVWTISIISWVGSITPWVKQGAEWLTNHSKTLDEKAKDNELSLSDIRTELQKLLSARDKPLLIVLDDLDRLSPDQMKGIFQLVKANMNFANVVFLLMFQRETVERGLRKVGFNGADYLEKIIQVPFTVPNISAARLEAILVERLETIFSDEPQLKARFDKVYWDLMFHRGMRPFFENLRHVYRYASTLAFHCRLLQGTEVAEINAVDLFALECLRVFAPDTYAGLPLHKGLLTSSEQFIREDDIQRARVNQIVDKLVNLAPSSYQPAVRQLIQMMFPNLDWVFTNTRYDTRIKMRWLINTRVCCDQVFDRYFELSVPITDIPNSLLHELAKRITDSEKFTALLLVENEDRQAEILQRMLGLVHEFPMNESLDVVRTMLCVGDKVSRRQSSVNWSPRQQVGRVLQLFLEQHDNTTYRSHLVIEAFLPGHGLIVIHQLLGWDYALRRNGDVGILDDNGLENLKNNYLQILRQWINSEPDNFLANDDHPAYLFDLDSYGNGDDETRRLIEKHIISPARFIQFAQGQVNTRTEYTGNEQIHTDYIEHSTLEQMMGLERWKEWANQLQYIELEDSDRLTLKLVREALARHTQGKSDSH
jgi:predicted KAP-like P-loop ATPase